MLVNLIYEQSAVDSRQHELTYGNTLALFFYHHYYIIIIQFKLENSRIFNYRSLYITISNK